MPVRSRPGDGIAARLFAEGLYEQKVYIHRPSLVLGRDVVVAQLLPRNEVHRLGSRRGPGFDEYNVLVEVEINRCVRAGRPSFEAGILDGMEVERRVAHLVLNPAAGGGRAAARRGEISAYLEGRGIGVEWHATRGTGDAGKIVAGLPDGALVVAVGGDGTIHEVAAACVGTGRVMGTLPLGSGNDYVKALGVGTDLGRALEIVAGGVVRSVDVGEVNGVLFNNGLGIGFDAEVAAGVTEAPAYLGGFGGYLWSVGRLLWGFECREACLKLGDEEILAKTILVAVALGTTYGARFRLAPESDLADGAFDVVWSEEVSRAEILRLIPSVLRGTHLAHPKIHFARTAEVEVSLKKPVPAHVDGEMLSPTRDFRARVIPRALHVLAPQPPG